MIDPFRSCGPRSWAALLVLALAAMVMAGAPARASDGEDMFVFDETNPLPEPVAAQSSCFEDGPGFATRRPFAGGFVFAIQCPGNNENFIQALVFATAEDGADARLLTFPVPGKRKPGFNPEEELSNADFTAGRNEISELLVDPEGDGWCRSEARWRFAGAPPAARLVFYRHTRDCAGKGGWKTVVDRRRSH